MSCFTVISANGCKWCDLAIEELEAIGEEYEVIKIEENPMIRSLCKMSGLKTVPQIFNPDGDHIGGYAVLREWITAEP